MTYHFVYPNGTTPIDGYGIDSAMMSIGYHQNSYNDLRKSYSSESLSSDSGSSSSDSYEYRGQIIARDTKSSQDIVRAPTPPPIIKRVVERAPTPEPPIMERVIIRPKAQEIVERVIEQPYTPPLRVIQKEMHEDAPPPIVRTRVIKVDRPFLNGFNQSGSPYNSNPCSGLSSLSNGIINTGNDYRAQSVLRSIGHPTVLPTNLGNNPSFSSASSFEYVRSEPISSTVPSSTMMMMMPVAQQTQPMGVMQQSQPQSSIQHQIMYRPLHMQSSMPRLSSSYIPQNYGYSIPPRGMSFGYRSMMYQHRMMIPRGMPMVSTGNMFGTPINNFPSQPLLFNPLAQQQLVY